MFFNTRSNNNVKDNDRGKSVGCSLFSFTGVRFFEPKFMSGLNNNGQSTKMDVEENTGSYNKKELLEIKVNTVKNELSKSQIKTRASKENIDPSLSSLSKFNQEKSSNKTQLAVEKKNKLPYDIVHCGIRGLNNIGNTCYMNSILQCLLNLSKFNSQLLYETKQTTFNKKKCEVSHEYAEMIKYFMQTLNTTSFVPSKLKSTLAKKKSRFMGNSQQDAQEFLTSFLEIVNEEMSRTKDSKLKYIELENNPNKKSIKKLSEEWWEYNKLRDDSIICDNFQGQLISIVTCKKCKNQSVTFDNIWGLPLSLSKSTSSISEMIKKNWSVENEISDYYCSVCKKLRDCTKKLEFFKLPEILVIQLKRFDYGKWKKDKIKTAIKLSDTLNIGEFINVNAPAQSHLYKLNGMVHHYGEVDYGHYTASVYKENEKKWYLLNDSKPSELTPDSPSNSVYLLFYEKM